jgi:diaminopimelate epimerase
MAGIPHLVVLCDDAEAVPLRERGPVLRHHPSLGAAGANVNWVSRQLDGRWRYRTFERGVEGETLACGTGAVATAVLLSAWGLAAGPVVTILTSSGRELQVRLPTAGGENAEEQGRGQPSLRGEGRVVFRGVIAAL